MVAQNYAHYWCEKMVERLINLGADHFFIGPGSRSTPLVSAIARNASAKIFLSVDERSVAFMALGYGKKSRRAGVVVTTSGTAVSNLYPAVTESFLSSVPMLLLTADRPFELRDCGANQTIFQANMFTNHCNKSFDLAPPSSIVSMTQSIAMLDQALSSTFHPHMGPVHMNVQLREPLANLPHEREVPFEKSDLRQNNLLNAKVSRVDMSEIAQHLAHKSGVIVVGELAPTVVQEKILTLAKKLQWPIYADITSNMRFIKHDSIVHHFDLALLNPSWAESLDYDVVLKFGGRIVAKRIWAFIERGTRLNLSLSNSPERIDHTGVMQHTFVHELPAAIDDLIARLPSMPSRVDDVEKINRTVRDFLENNRNNEAYFSSRLIAQISEPVNFFVSSSMPIRDLDQFAQPTTIPIHLYASRGASGIDGVVSTAVGMTIADELPGILLIGDVAFIHDTNGLSLLRMSTKPLLIVVFNNNGGGIFHFLPIAKEPDVVTPYLDTPHDINIADLCRAHRVKHERVTDAVEFDEAIRQFFHERTTRVVEVMIDREVNVRHHNDFYERIASLAV